MIIRNVSLANDIRYTEADVIPCSGNEPRDAEERQALRGAVLKYAQTQTAHILLVLPTTLLILRFLCFCFESGETASRLSPEQTKSTNSGEQGDVVDLYCFCVGGVNVA